MKKYFSYQFFITLGIILILIAVFSLMGLTIKDCFEKIIYKLICGWLGIVDLVFCLLIYARKQEEKSKKA